MEHILNTVKHFKAVEHRIEYVATKKGVAYYNDSKGTNPDAAIQGIRAMNRPTILIGGGYDKQSEYDEWIEAFDGKVRLLVLIGQTKEKIAECARKHGFNNIVFADTFEECMDTVSYTHLRAHETRHDLVCRLLLEKKKKQYLIHISAPTRLGMNSYVVFQYVIQKDRSLVKEAQN